MLECLILGDSIAVGLGQARPECVTIARSGYSSKRWYRGFGLNPYYKDDAYKIAVISLGTNDFVGDNTSEILYSIRKNTNAQFVVWILPSWNLKPQQHAIVREIANEFHDKVLSIHEFVGHDGIHPPNLTAYKKIAEAAKDPATLKSK
jgi:hypothetical protein